jgi:nucleotide-binding universal stress UspA family protein
MIKDVMVCLDGGPGDELRLAAATAVAERFDANVIGLFMNVLPDVPAIVEPTGVDLTQEARDTGDVVATALGHRLAELPGSAELRRFDVFADTAPEVAAQEARTADAFVALRPSDSPMDRDTIIESVMFGSGRHIILVPDLPPAGRGFGRVVIAWDRGREAARAVGEALPYLYEARQVSVVVVDDADPTEIPVRPGADMVKHLANHGIDAVACPVERRSGGVGTILIEEAQRLEANLIVAGGYSHSRWREKLLGGVTRDLLHKSPIPVLFSH